MASKRMKYGYSVLVTLCIVVFGFMLTRDTLARIAWEQYKRADLAYVLNYNDSNLAMLIGNYHFGIGEYDLRRASIFFEQALSVEHGIFWGNYQLARVDFVEGNFGKALSLINKELEANPGNLRSLYVRGLIYAYRGFPGDLSLAEKDFRRFVAWAPSEWAGYNDLAWILTEEGKYTEAKEAIEESFIKVQQAEENPWLWNSVGLAELNLFHYSDAEQSFAKALELAQGLSLDDWHGAYPGNNPEGYSDGLTQFKDGIAENIRRARVK